MKRIYYMASGHLFRVDTRGKATRAVDILSHIGDQLSLKAWGTEIRVNTYGPGEHAIEVWLEDRALPSDTERIHRVIQNVLDIYEDEEVSE